MLVEIKEKINVDEIVKTIVNGYGPVEKIIIFGSQARADADEYSDLDLIIIKKTNKRFLERLLEVPLFPIPVDVFVYTPEEFEQMKENENPFIISALESAREVYPFNEKS
ncbi:MAG TPA: nucleotidyltransferase domain-containing protein [Candidatus Brocadiia bacterium]|nr:nucleotidyltransferase domain-containing protein [Candidatus Brocadiales bacterium]